MQVMGSPMPRSAVLVSLAVALGLGGCGGGSDTAAPDEPSPAPATEAEAPGRAPPEDARGDGGGPDGERPTGPAETPAGDPRPTAAELGRSAARAVVRYVEALDARDGEAACRLLVPGALDEVELPEPRPTCAASLEASIGYRDPRELPVWESARVTSAPPPRLDAGAVEAAVTATVVTRFADRDDVSVEDDVVYLVRNGGAGWLVAKPSSTLYRAVGIADVPPDVLAAP